MNLRARSALLITALAAAVAAGPALPAAAAPAHHRPAAITGTADTLHPEGATWDAAHGRFLVSSLRHGTVSAVRADGSVTTLVDDPAVLVSAVGIHVDAARNRVLVANGDPGVSVRTAPGGSGRIAGIGAYDLTTGRRLFYTDLAAVAADGGSHLANDLVVGPDGTAYVTDSFAPIVYRVAPDGAAGVLVRDSRLAAPQGGFGLNGIVRQGRTLLVGKYDDGTLWRLPIDHPQQLAEIPVTGPANALTGLDGLLLRPDGTLQGITNRLGGTGATTRVDLRSADGWRTARTTVHPLTDPAPTVLTPGPAGSVYVLDGRLDLLFAGTPVDTFTLHRI
ncbi:SMP-30/gluconolactonase/LRE family protein [Streptomyces sp. NRRL B-24484]|uniref:SMP-30/gluconolactonase/LRE family protein n=1 Tax=Streptomyces sp. NRRL B-24484 TaxID=1463833 RepID=UPI0006938B59|nr:SMP-30/gluconolactonase/LRE family protein [Streptomyces sp. NRRL B-24484]